MKSLDLVLLLSLCVGCQKDQRAKSEIPKERSKAEGASTPVAQKESAKPKAAERPPTAQPMKFDPKPDSGIPRNAKLSKRKSGKFDLNVFTFSDGASGFDQVVEVRKSEKRAFLFSHVTEFATADNQLVLASYEKNAEDVWALSHQTVDLESGTKTKLDCSGNCGFLAFAQGKKPRPIALTPMSEMNGSFSLFDKKGKTIASFPTKLNFPIGANGGSPINRYFMNADGKELIEYLPNSCRISVYETTEWNMIRKEGFEFDTDNMTCPDGEKAFSKMIR